jgi:hypothetical protein
MKHFSPLILVLAFATVQGKLSISKKMKNPVDYQEPIGFSPNPMRELQATFVSG